MKKLNIKKSLLTVLLIAMVAAGGVYAFSVVKSPEDIEQNTTNQDNGENTDDARQTGEPQQEPQAKPGDKTKSVESDEPMDAPADPNIQKKPDAVKPPEEN